MVFYVSEDVMKASEEEKLLIRMLWHNEKGAHSQVYHENKNYLLNLAQSILYDRKAAEDVLHDVFVSFLESAPGLKSDGSLKGYLAECVKNKAIDKNRKAARLKAISQRETTPADADENDPVSSAIEKEEFQRVIQALGQLPSKESRIIILRDLDEKKFGEIAKLLQEPVATVRRLYHNGFEKLKSMLNCEE